MRAPARPAPAAARPAAGRCAPVARGPEPLHPPSGGRSPAARPCRCGGTPPRPRRPRPARAPPRLADALALRQRSPANVSYSAVGSPVSVAAPAAAAPPRRSSTSSSRNRITVMLSRPPASFAAAISARPICSSEPLRPRSIGLSSGSWTMAVRPSEQSRNRSPARAGKTSTSTSTSGSAPSARVITRALRMRLGLLLGQLAAGDELADERVVAGQPDQVAVAEQVGARVADVRDDDVVVVDVRGGHASSPCRRAARRRADWLVDLARSPGLDQLAQRLAGGSRRRAARARTACTASSEATSPACAPPIPSATTNSGARTKKLSSLPWRWRPEVGVVEVLGDAQHASALEGELGVADADPVPRVQGLRSRAAARRSGRCRSSTPDPPTR